MQTSAQVLLNSMAILDCHFRRTQCVRVNSGYMLVIYPLSFILSLFQLPNILDQEKL